MRPDYEEGLGGKITTRKIAPLRDPWNKTPKSASGLFVIRKEEESRRRPTVHLSQTDPSHAFLTNEPTTSQISPLNIPIKTSKSFSRYFFGIFVILS